MVVQEELGEAGWEGKRTHELTQRGSGSRNLSQGQGFTTVGCTPAQGLCLLPEGRTRMDLLLRAESSAPLKGGRKARGQLCQAPARLTYTPATLG